MGPQRETPLAVFTHCLHTRHELAEEAPPFALRALRTVSKSLGFLGSLWHGHYPLELRSLERCRVSSSIAALRRRFSLRLRSTASSLSYSVSSQICTSSTR